MTEMLSSRLSELTQLMGTNNDSDTLRTLIQMKYNQLKEQDENIQH